VNSSIKTRKSVKVHATSHPFVGLDPVVKKSESSTQLAREGEMLPGSRQTMSQENRQKRIEDDPYVAMQLFVPLWG
jgi:hypothetical protein